MEIVTTPATDPVNTQAMSDEQFMQHMNSQAPIEASSNEVQPTQTNVIEDTQPSITTPSTVETTPPSDGTVVDTTQAITVDPSAQQSQEPVTPVTTPVETTPSVPATETGEIDYKAFYEKATQSYKANGHEHPGVKDPEKLIKALQMATDYAQKTSAIKPILRKAKLLEGISDEDLTEMLEFKKGNPEVIKKALKQHNIDPMLVDLENINYQAHSVVPSNDQVEFQNVMDTLVKDPVLFNKLDNVVINQLDEKSRLKLLSGDGSYLNAFAQEMVIGKTETTPSRFDIVMPMVQQHKLFNPEQVVGMTDLDIYISLAEKYESTKQVAVTPTAPVATQPIVNPVPVVDPDIATKREAASITTTANNKAKPTYDPTKLSDAEFLKLMEDGALFQSK